MHVSPKRQHRRLATVPAPQSLKMGSVSLDTHWSLMPSHAVYRGSCVAVTASLEHLRKIQIIERMQTKYGISRKIQGKTQAIHISISLEYVRAAFGIISAWPFSYAYLKTMETILYAIVYSVVLNITLSHKQLLVANQLCATNLFTSEYYIIK